VSDPHAALGRVAVVPGTCLVARTGNGVIVIGPVTPEQAAVRDALVACLREVGSASDLPGDGLGRRLVGVIVSEPSETVPPFAAAAIGTNGIAVMVTAGMEASWLDADGSHPLSGRQSALWLDHVITTPVDRLVLGAEPLALADPDPALDLRDGAVLGDAVVVELRAAPVTPAPPSPPPVAPPAAPPAAAPVASEPTPPPLVAPQPVLADALELEPEPAPPILSPTVSIAPVVVAPEPEPIPEPEPREPVIADLDFEIVPLGGGFEARDPLPVAGEPLPAGPTDSAPDRVGDVEVFGIICIREHFNHPEARFCASCGVDFQARDLVPGARPPLGILVIDDGSAFTLDTDYVVGREPHDAPEVIGGAARGLVLEDPERSVSRIHAVLTLSGWDVVVTDRGSANGTYLLPPGAPEWVRLESEQSAPLGAGARVAVGRRTFLFESHHAAG
jgi:FHA domain